MKNLVFEYPAVRVQQTAESKPVILFGASALEIEQWAGIPQKKSFSPDQSESSGFQRTTKPQRLNQLKSFYDNKQNVVQNSLTCALKRLDGSNVEFKANEDGASGILKIELPNLYEFDLLDLFGLLRRSLESRIGDKKEYIDTTLINSLKASLKVATDTEVDSYNGDLNGEDDESEAETVLFEESHLEDFLRDVVARHEILKEIDDDSIRNADTFLGFDRETILSFLLPITLVDGQHRLKGAVLDSRDSLNSQQFSNEIATRIAKGESSEEVEASILLRESRVLPVSLLLSDDPIEQVFQFVVINQKATPIGKSLLGTIISTSLTTDEMDSVSDRLKQSGIMLEEARAITWAARNPESPFYNLVERGVPGHGKDLLQWNVLGNLIKIFKELKGGSFFHKKTDFAKKWKEKYLVRSPLVEGDTVAECMQQWSDLDGIWKQVFIAFWTKVKCEFAQEDNPDQPHNFWGNTRTSNIFNKISLTIIAADFFNSLCETKRTIESIEQIDFLVDDWLEDFSRNYFNRDWDTVHLKKDAGSTRKQWSKLWEEYRDDPSSLHSLSKYREPYKA